MSRVDLINANAGGPSCKEGPPDCMNGGEIDDTCTYNDRNALTSRSY